VIRFERPLQLVLNAARPGGFASAIGKISYAGFNPTFKIRGTAAVFHPLEIVSVPVDQLGEIVGSLSDERQSIVAALDELPARAWK
jgi:toxin CcdB